MGTIENIFKIKKNLIVLTAAHVVDGEEYVSVEHADKHFLATVIFFDNENDVAILSVPNIEGRDPMSLKLSSSQSYLDIAYYYVFIIIEWRTLNFFRNI